ncbi:hypothetical protein [Acinetobacter pollinis]|uniref:DUF4123 domain-containing protein n=1 Tax=Acinetobacter pollinis TaxID=2605270 RepID=A0ABU6DTE5_9GAMM|nr:hypothetical protein [Acinetobacter pollinis]MEB5477117.1 hypothetical protein [Acinetobacter pollinis]
MSLAVAFNLDDYAILATDKRGTLHYVDANKEDHLIKTEDTYQKLRQIPFGFFASAGDYLITECFYAECISSVAPRNLDQILENTYYRYCKLQGICHFSEMTTILLIAKGFDDTEQDKILEINIQFENIKIEEISPMNVVALMANMNPNHHFWDNIASYLRSSQEFSTFDEFFYYHFHLIKYIWQEQHKFDSLVSKHIDFYLHDKKTSKGILLPAEKLQSIPFTSLQKLLI